MVHWLPLTQTGLLSCTNSLRFMCLIAPPHPLSLQAVRVGHGGRLAGIPQSHCSHTLPDNCPQLCCGSLLLSKLTRALLSCFSSLSLPTSHPQPTGFLAGYLLLLLGSCARCLSFNIYPSSSAFPVTLQWPKVLPQKLCLAEDSPFFPRHSRILLMDLSAPVSFSQPPSELRLQGHLASFMVEQRF